MIEAGHDRGDREVRRGKAPADGGCHATDAHSPERRAASPGGDRLNGGGAFVSPLPEVRTNSIMLIGTGPTTPDYDPEPDRSVSLGGSWHCTPARPSRPPRPGRLATLSRRAPVAQLDRASVYGTEGHRFESCRARRRSPANAGVSCFQDPRLPRPRGPSGVHSLAKLTSLAGTSRPVLATIRDASRLAAAYTRASGGSCNAWIGALRPRGESACCSQAIAVVLDDARIAWSEVVWIEFERCCDEAMGVVRGGRVGLGEVWRLASELGGGRRGDAPRDG